jgi:formate dehydrogenase subunit gamma
MSLRFASVARICRPSLLRARIHARTNWYGTHKILKINIFLGSKHMTATLSSAPKQDFSLELANQVVQPFADQPGALIEALHKLQDTFGYVDEAAMPMLARLFNVSRAEVHGVTSFYHDFRRSKPGRHTIRICQAEACQAMGSEALTQAAKDLLGCDFHETSADGVFTLEKVYCLGNCACSPNIMIDKQVHARMSPEKFQKLAAELASQAEAK